MRLEKKLHKEKLKQFPYNFNEDEFIVSDFKIISLLKRRESASVGRMSDSDTTEYSREIMDISEGNLSDSNGDFNKFSSYKFKTSDEEEKYDPDRDCQKSIRGRTKQKVYLKFSTQDKARKYSYDSSCSEGKFMNLIM